MRLEIESSDDLVGLYGRYIELVEQGTEGPLELVFAPGTYGVASIGPISLDLGGNPAPREPKLDVVLRGTGTTVLRDLGILVNARSLVLEDLILTGRHQNLLAARVARRFAMSRCVVIGNDWDGPWPGALVRVGGVYEQPAYSVELEDVWLVRNGQQSEAALIEIAPATGSFVYEVLLTRVTALQNGVASDVRVTEARTIHVTDSLVVKSGAGGATFLRHGRSGRVALERNTFVVDDPAAVLAEVDDPQSRPRSFGVELTGSAVYATGASRSAPAGVRGADVRDGAALVRDEDALAAIIGSLAAALPGPEAQAQLRGALGIPVG